MLEVVEDEFADEELEAAELVLLLLPHPTATAEKPTRTRIRAERERSRRGTVIRRHYTLAAPMQSWDLGVRGVGAPPSSGFGLYLLRI